MKKFWLYFIGFICVILLLLYLAFLFYLPRAVDLKPYIPEIQKIVKEQANIDLFIDKPKITTTPSLQAGIKTGKITAKLPDGSIILATDGIKVRISVLRLLLLTVKATCVDIKSPKINLEIANGEQFKVVKLVEDILNQQKELAKETPQGENPPASFDISKIKILVPSSNISNYTVLVNDLKTSHTLTLKGDVLDIGYNNGKTARVKTNAKLYSDDKTNITLKLDLDSFIPPASEKDPDDDPAEEIELPFVNPVLVYRNYDLKSDADLKIKLRKNKNDKIVINGYSNINNVTMNLSGLQLPYSYLKANFYGNSADIDTNIVVKHDQQINLKGKAAYGDKPYLNVDFNTDKIYFNDLIILAKAFLDTLHIPNNLSMLKASGYWVGRCHIKTDFKKLKSDGAIIARGGSISNGRTNLVFSDINANLIFEDNTLKIVDTHTYINNNILTAEGKIDTDSFSDIKIHSEKLPLPGLFLAFAPASLRHSIALSSGALSVDAQVKGMIKHPVAYANVVLDNLTVQNSSMTMNDEKLVAGIVTDLVQIDGIVSNKNFSLQLPSTKSVIKNPNLSVKLNNKDIEIVPTKLLINSSSEVEVKGSINNYATAPIISILVDGHLNAHDLRQFAGKEAEPFIAAKGDLPIKAKVSGTDKKQEVVLQLFADNSNYITPVDIQSMLGQQSVLQAKLFNKKDGIQIRKTGIYTGVKNFTDDLYSNLEGAKPVIEISGTVVNTDTDEPFINMIRLDIPEQLKGKFTAFPSSVFNAEGKLLVFGKVASPIMRGSFKISDLSIPELYTKMSSLNLGLLNKNIDLDIRRLLLNNSDLNISLRTDINPHPVFTISRLNINSNEINLDTIMQVPEALDKYLVKSEPNNNANSSNSDIPLLLRNGSVNIKTLKTGNILAENTTGRLSMRNSILFLNDLNTSVFDGSVGGDIAVNLSDMVVGLKTNGKDLNVAKALLDLANTKDALTGKMKFDTDMTLNVKDTANMDVLMKSIAGNVIFTIADGQLGPFGRLENMILAENIRESQFFQTALGGVIDNLATIDTTHFKTMDGTILFEDGIAKIQPIVTTGNVMSLHIAGDFDLIKNNIDMKVRAKLGSATANLLGPLAQLNPINLVQVTPGLNVVMAKMFFLFCEELSPEETAALPHLETELDDKLATKFQIVLRGDVAKPLTLVKSFKWLALASEIQAAENFASNLPDPSIVGDANNATIEEILKAQEEQAKEDAKPINKMKKYLKNIVNKQEQPKE